MHSLRIKDFRDWRRRARGLIAHDLKPTNVQLLETSEQKSLFGDAGEVLLKPENRQSRTFSVDREFVKLAETVGYHRDPQRWNLLYRMLWRLTHGERNLLELMTDDHVLQIHNMEKEVRRDAHKMKAFVRFRKVDRDGVEHFIAWHRPDHRIVRKVAPFFSRRFKGMNWTILTPDESVSWDQLKLDYGSGVPRSEAPDEDSLEELWLTYYGSIFNPARVKVKMMKSEMPVRHWPTLPEAQIIDDLVESAPERVQEMIARNEGFAETAADYIESKNIDSYDELRLLAENCRACDLHHDATQTVFGVGPIDARIVLVGEQPGDQEDIAGQPFVGPAGKLLDEALAGAGIDRNEVFITNIVKHFKHETTNTPKGKKRLHAKPNAREIRCCKPWFEAEWELLSDAEVLVCLGATAAKAIIGPNFRITKQRGKFFHTGSCSFTIATWHPAAILRTADPETRNVRNLHLINDLKKASTRIDDGGGENY